MHYPVVEQHPDKSVNVFLKSWHFKLFPIGPHGRPEWMVWTDDRFEPVPSPKVRKRLNRIWAEHVHCATHAPGPIPRFPRIEKPASNEDIGGMLRASQRALRHGNIARVRKIMARVLSATQPHDADIRSWEDLPLASAAEDQELKWLADGLIPAGQVTVIAAAKDSCKSILMLSLTKAATTGDQFLDAKCRQKLVPSRRGTISLGIPSYRTRFSNI